MGFRTVIVLNNDQAHEWLADPELGKKIFQAAASMTCDIDRRRSLDLPYGAIVEQVHADVQTVAILDGYAGAPIAHSHWHRGQDSDTKNLECLKAFAEKLGYRVVRKSVKV